MFNDKDCWKKVQLLQDWKKKSIAIDLTESESEPQENQIRVNVRHKSKPDQDLTSHN